MAAETRCSRRDRRGWIALALGVGTLLATDAGAGTHATGLGGATIALPDPALMGRDNPAVLGLARGRGVRLNLFEVGIALGNNAYSLSDYTRYNGAEITEADEDVILSRVQGDGWTFTGEARALGPSLAIGPVAVHARGVGIGGGRIPHEVLELIFDGNVVDETIDFGNTDGAGWAAIEVGVGVGFGLDRWFRQMVSEGETTGGLQVRYLQGLYYAGVERSGGRIVTRVDTLYGTGRLDLLTATGGSGYAIDLGILHHRGRWNYGLRATGVLGSISWRHETERTVYEVEAGTLDIFNEDDSDDEIVSSSDTTYAVGGFRRPVPTRLGLGVAHERGPWVFAGDAELTMRGRMVGEDALRLSLGVERSVLASFRFRLGGEVGGLAGTSVTGGTSVLLGPWRLDLDVGTFSTVNPFAPKGVRFGLGSALVLG